MTIFTIENESNNITAHGTIEEARLIKNAHIFKTEKALAKLAESWPTSRLVDIWNGVPGAVAAKKFTDRTKAVSRIWNGIQSLGDSIPAEAPTEPAETEASPDMPPSDEATLPESEQVEVETPASETEGDVSEHTPNVAPEETKSTKKTTRQKKTSTGETKAPREESKTSQVIAMLKLEGGTTLEEIMTTMGWLKHTTRAMLSAGGSLTKKHGFVITSEKVGDKRVYSIKA